MSDTPQPKRQELVPTPLPRTVSELDARRRTPLPVNLKAAVRQIHRSLWENPEYQQYFAPIEESQAIQGKLRWDTSCIVHMVHDYAMIHGPTIVAESNLYQISVRMRAIRKEYGISRNIRRREMMDEHGTDGC